MKVNKILMAVIFGFLLFFVFNVAYADDAPLLSPIQAEGIAQDYLNTNGYSSYKADIPGTYPNVEMLSKVKVLSTGKVTWVDAGDAKSDAREDVNAKKYEIIVYRAYVVNVLDSSGAEVGKIYVDGDHGTVVYTDLPDTGDNNGGTTDNNNNSNNNTTTDNNQDSNWLQDLLDALMGFFQQLLSIFTGQ